MWAAALLLAGGLMAADDPLISPDYLGIPAEVSTKGTASLPSDQPFQPSAAPATSSGGGAAPSAASTLRQPRFSLSPTSPTTLGAQPSTGGVVTAGVDPASTTIPIPDDVKTAVTALPPETRSDFLQKLASMGGKFAQLGSELTKLFPDDLGTFNRGEGEEAFQTQRAGERIPQTIVSSATTNPDQTIKELQQLRDPFGFGDFAFEGDAASAFGLAGADGLTASDRLTAAAAEFGETGAEGVASNLAGAAQVAGGALTAKKILDIFNSRGDTDQKVFDTVGALGGFAANLALPVVGGVAANLVHEYISTPIIEAIFGEFGPSKRWLNFPNELAQTLSLTESSNQKLAAALANASNENDIKGAIAAWKSDIGGRVGGFGAGSGEFDIPDVPGATGTKHEGGISANFNPQTAGLRALMGVARRGGTLAERIQAFREAAVGAMSNTERISADPTGSLLTPEMQAGWKSSLIEQTQQSHPEIAQALQAGELSPLQAQGVLDALNPGTTSFVVPPSPEILARFAPADRGLTPQEQAAQDFALAGFSAGGE